MRSKGLVVTVLVLVALSVLTTAHAKSGEVKIRVTYDEGKGAPERVAGAMVQVWDAAGNIVAEGITDSDGNLTVTGLEGRTDYVARAVCPSGLHTGTRAFSTNRNGGSGLVQVAVK